MATAAKAHSQPLLSTFVLSIIGAPRAAASPPEPSRGERWDSQNTRSRLRSAEGGELGEKGRLTMGTGGVGTVRFAVITDVHANLPALDAALARIDDAGCDFIVHTGDAIGIGPYPAETLGRMLARPDMRFIMGNHDALFAFGLPSPRPSWFSAEEEAHQRWTHAQLDRGLRESVRQWPYRFTIPVDRSSITFCHYGRKTEQREQEEQDHPDALVASSFATITHARI